jgi:hypothetical protein
MTMTHSGQRALITLLLGMLLQSSLSAQTKSHGYVSAGAGATDLSGGIDWVVGDGPLSIGAEVGVGWVFLAALNASYHPLARRASPYDVFATIGYAGLGSSEFSSHGVNVGGGATYWPASRVGLRFDAFRFLPASTTNDIPAAERSRSRYWGVRAGVAFRVR